jgi:hypothetical protein
MVYPAIKDEAALILRRLVPLRLIVLAASLYVAPYLQVDMVKLANGLLIDNPFPCEFDPSIYLNCSAMLKIMLLEPLEAYPFF